MSNKVDELHNKMMSMPLQAILFMACKAVETNMDDERLKIILTYVEYAISKWKLNLRKRETP